MEGCIDPYRFDLGSAVLDSTEPLVAGGFFSRILTYTAGKYGLPEHGRLLICKRLSCDMQIPQFEDPRASGYVSAQCSNPRVRPTCSYNGNIYLDDWRSAIVLTVSCGYLDPGDELRVYLGDIFGGGPGIRTQTFPEERHTFKVAIDIFNRNHFYELPASPEIRVVAGPPEKIELICSQTPPIGRETRGTLRVLDSWGNVTPFAGSVGVDPGAKAEPETIEFRPEDNGIKSVSPAFSEACRPQLRAQTLIPSSLPVVPQDRDAAYSLYWADLHGQTRSTVGTGTVAEYYRYARDCGCVDAAAWQGNDFRVRREDWQEVIEETGKFNEPGRFVTLLGYEWSGNRSGGGDYNIYYAGDNEQIHRSSHAGIEDISDVDTDRFPISALWESFEERGDVLAVGHIGGRACNLDFYDPRFVRLIEVHSHHGSFEWFLEDALQRGLTVGFVANSDDHTGRLGLVYPNRRSNEVVTFDVRGGLTGIYAEELTRPALFNALQERRTYATNGERILVKFRCDGHWLGEEFACPGSPTLEVDIRGTAPLLDVELKRGLETIYRYPVNAPSGEPGLRRIRVQWGGVSQKSGRDKKVCWQGGLALDRGRIVSFEPYALDQHDDTVTRISNNTLRFATHTSGDPDGVFLDIEAAPGAELHFYSGVLSTRVLLDGVGGEPAVFPDNRGLAQVLISEVSRQGGDWDAVFSYTDEEEPSARPGGGKIRSGTPYWIRVLQVNGGQAWSSPIYIHRS